MHNIIEGLDRVITTEPAWHGLEEIEEVITRENGANDFEVEEKTLVTADGTPVRGFKALCRKSDGYPIHVANHSFHVIPNGRMWDLIGESLVGVDYEVVSSGTIAGLRKAFVSVRLKDEMEYVVNGDEFRAHLTFLNGLDGKTSFEVFDSNVRVVCENTFNAARSSKLGAKINFKVWHLSGADAKVTEIGPELENAFEKRKEFFTSLEYLAHRPMTAETAEALTAGFMADHSTTGELTKPGERATAEVVELFANGKGNHGRTAYDLFNAGTEYWTSGSGSGKSAGHRFTSANFGTAASRKGDWYDLLVSSDAELEEAAARGEELLAGAAG